LQYDPEGNDTDRETVILLMTWWQSSVDVSKLYLRFGTTKRSLNGTLSSDIQTIVTGNFQMPNSKPTCVDLMEWSHIFDTYCYDPSGVKDIYTGIIYSWDIEYLSWLIVIDHIEYNPDWTDKNNESIKIISRLLDQDIVLSWTLSIRLNKNNKILWKNIVLWNMLIFTGNFQFPNSQPTCIELLYQWLNINTYCYDPFYNQNIDPQEYYSGLQLQRILPNPKDKDIKNLNEKFALSWKNWNEQILTKRVKLLVGKTSISLSWYQFTDDELIVASPKALTNQAACVRLIVDNQEIDKFCYPQAKEWLVYYHPRLDKWPQTLPSSLIDSLDSQWVDLSELRLTKSGKKICLTYDKIQIRCMNGWSSTTSAKNKALLTLWNAYIRKMSELVYAKQMDYILMEQWRKAYRTLSDEIKWWNLWNLTLYGQSMKVTNIESYVTALYTIHEDEYITDQVSRIFFWHQAVDEYYRQLYKN
jgi:hypothetical protein